MAVDQRCCSASCHAGGNEPDHREADHDMQSNQSPSFLRVNPPKDSVQHSSTLLSHFSDVCAVPTRHVDGAVIHRRVSLERLSPVSAPNCQKPADTGIGAGSREVPLGRLRLIEAGIDLSSVIPRSTADNVGFSVAGVQSISPPLADEMVASRTAHKYVA